jgi:acyl CoA:acetate/3-ketoacid CoA transferase beta subunit
LGVFDVADNGLKVVEIAPGIEMAQITASTEANLVE